MKRAHLWSLLLLALLAPSAKADTVYDYTGNAFTSCTYSGTATCVPTILTGQFVVSTALTPGTTENLLATGTLESFSFTDGVMSAPSKYSVSSPGFANEGFLAVETVFSVTTNASDQIVAWDISASGFAGTGQDGFATIGTLNGQNAFDTLSSAIYYPVSGGYQESNSDTQGIWVDPPSGTVPEPGTLPLLAAGLIGLAALLRRQQSAALFDPAQ